MTPQTESQFFCNTLYPALTFKNGLLYSVAAAAQRGGQS